MRFFKFLQVLTIVLLLNSCAVPKIVYLQDMQSGESTVVTNVTDIKLCPKDKISILVNTKDPMLTNLFNLPYVARQLGLAVGQSTSQGISGYTIDKNGEIDFPVLGKVHIAGLSRSEVAEFIKQELISNDLVKDPVVTVEYMNLSVSVLGEVTRPGRYNIDKDRLTLLDAIGMAGDLTIQGRRDNVLVQRENNGKQTVYKVDLNSGESLYASPAFYLQQNDVIYVEPNGKKTREATVNGNYFRSGGFWMGLASLAISITTLIITAK